MNLKHDSYIGGAWVGGTTTVDVLDPATEERIAAVANASVDDCLTAVGAAHHALPVVAGDARRASAARSCARPSS